MSRFKQKIRIDPKQLEWIRQNKGKYKTLAGKLTRYVTSTKMSIAKRIRLKKELGQYVSVGEYATLEAIKQMHENEMKERGVSLPVPRSDV